MANDQSKGQKRDLSSQECGVRKRNVRNTMAGLHSEVNTATDDSGSFTVQGSSASQMTPAKVMDVIAMLPGCEGPEADAVSAYTQVQIEDAPRLLKNPKSECPDTL